MLFFAALILLMLICDGTLPRTFVAHAKCHTLIRCHVYRYYECAMPHADAITALRWPLITAVACSMQDAVDTLRRCAAFTMMPLRRALATLCHAPFIERGCVMICHSCQAHAAARQSCRYYDKMLRDAERSICRHADTPLRCFTPAAAAAVSPRCRCLRHDVDMSYAMSRTPLFHATAVEYIRYMLSLLSYITS